MNIKETVAKLLGRTAKADEGSPEAKLEAAMGALPEETRNAIMAAIGMLMQEKSGKPVEPPKPQTPPEPKKPEEPTVQKSAEIVALEKRAEEMTTLVAKLQKDLETERLAKRIAEETEVAKSCPYVPGDFAKRAERLVKIKDLLGEDAYKAEVAEMKAANEMIKNSGALQSKGTSRSSAGTASEKIETMTREIMTKAATEGKPLTYEQAWTRAVKADPQTYQLAKREMNEGN